jgi:hypothetical protein
MKLGFVLLILLVLCGCQMNNPPTRPGPTDIVYFQDSRTRLCFAAINSTSYAGYEIMSISAVPCEQVRSLLPENRVLP